MKIKYNNFLIITPIFFTIAFVIGFLNHNNEKNEVNWGLRTKAESISLTSKIFIEQMLQTKKLSSILNTLEPKFQSIISYGQAKRFYISENNRIILDTNENSVKELDLADLKETRVSKIFSKEDSKYIAIHIPIEGAKQNTVLSIEIDASQEALQLDESFHEMMYTLLLISLAGLISAYILSKIVIAKISSLSKTANAIASGNFDEEILHSGNIREFTDLADTLNVMKSIMKNIIFKTKNVVIEDEKFRDEEDTADVYMEQLHTSQASSLESIQLLITPLGNPPPNCFFNSFTVSNTLYGFMGKIEPLDSVLDTSIKAHSAQTYISNQLEKNSFDLTQVHQLFSLIYLELVSVDPSGNVHAFSLSNSLKETKEEKLNGESVMLICEPNSNVRRSIDIYLKSYEEISLQELQKDIIKLLTGRVNEPFMMIKKG